MKIRLSLYWKCQIAGWILAGLYWSYTALDAINLNYRQLMVDLVGDVLVCIAITHAYRNFALKWNWQHLHLKALVWRIIPAIFVLGFLFMVLIAIKLYIVRLYFVPNFNTGFSTFFATSRLTLFSSGIRLMSIWMLAYHLYHYAQREINAVKENARLSIITKEAQINNLSAQLNPHFFFNSLNNIKFLVAENPESARRAIDLLSDLLRNSLYNKGDKLVPLQDEISLVKDYLELEKLRFEERLQVKIEVDERLENTTIPPLSIQTLVENAIKHGVAKSMEGGLVAVKIERKENALQVSVQNPGELNGVEQTAGLGLKNLKERLQLQYNGRAALAMSATSGKHVLFTLSIPVV